jgi:hypothetical protein
MLLRLTILYYSTVQCTGIFANVFNEVILDINIIYSLFVLDKELNKF